MFFTLADFKSEISQVDTGIMLSKFSFKYSLPPEKIDAYEDQIKKIKSPDNIKITIDKQNHEVVVSAEANASRDDLLNFIQDMAVVKPLFEFETVNNEKEYLDGVDLVKPKIESEAIDLTDEASEISIKDEINIPAVPSSPALSSLPDTSEASSLLVGILTGDVNAVRKLLLTTYPLATERYSGMLLDHAIKSKNSEITILFLLAIFSTDFSAEQEDAQKAKDAVKKIVEYLLTVEGLLDSDALLTITDGNKHNLVQIVRDQENDHLIIFLLEELGFDNINLVKALVGVLENSDVTIEFLKSKIREFVKHACDSEVNFNEEETLKENFLFTNFVKKLRDFKLSLKDCDISGVPEQSLIYFMSDCDLLDVNRIIAGRIDGPYEHLSKHLTDQMRKLEVRGSELVRYYKMLEGAKDREILNRKKEHQKFSDDVVQPINLDAAWSEISSQHNLLGDLDYSYGVKNMLLNADVKELCEKVKFLSNDFQTDNKNYSSDEEKDLTNKLLMFYLRQIAFKVLQSKNKKYIEDQNLSGYRIIQVNPDAIDLYRNLVDCISALNKNNDPDEKCSISLKQELLKLTQEKTSELKEFEEEFEEAFSKRDDEEEDEKAETVKSTEPEKPKAVQPSALKVAEALEKPVADQPIVAQIAEGKLSGLATALGTSLTSAIRTASPAPTKTADVVPATDDVAPATDVVLATDVAPAARAY